MMAFRARIPATNTVLRRETGFAEHGAIIEAKPTADHPERALPKRWYNLDVVLTDDFPRR